MNGTRFSVQEFFMEAARENVSSSLPELLAEKLRNLPVYEVLSARWGERPAST